MSDDLFGGSAAATAASNEYDASATSRCSKAWSRFAAGPACISAASTNARCTILPPKCSTTAMDEAVAGHANRIEVKPLADGSLTITDNGRGIPVDPHPKFPGQVGARSHFDHAPFGRQIF
jgi:topoisomerase-4 subunit B